MSDAPSPNEHIRQALTRRLDAIHDLHGAPNDQTPPPVSDHELLRRIGSGSYGDVWMARSTLGTLRAVKVIYRSRFHEDRPYEREFQGMLKYEPLSRSHPGLVQILHVGRNEALGCFYYVMELADPGETSTAPSAPSTDTYSPRTLRSEVLKHGPMPVPEAAALTLRLAQALGYLHHHGLVHRDIKPGNVIFVAGVPKIADIGLVTDAGGSTSFVGTEGFIAPEGPGGAQADLYALGKVLYEISTGLDRHSFPSLPDSLDVSGSSHPLLELNEVMTRACAPTLGERYPSVREMEADLNLVLAGRSLRLTRQHERDVRRLSRVAAVAAGLLLAAIVGLWWAKREEARAQALARREGMLRSRAEKAELESSQQLYSALLEQARATVRLGEMGQRIKSLAALRKAAAFTNSAELRREALAALALPDLEFIRTIPVARGATLSVLDPAFQRMAVCRGNGPVLVHEIGSTNPPRVLTATTNLPVYVGGWSPDGRFLAVKRDYESSGMRADLEVWEVASSRLVTRIPDVHHGAMAFHPNQPWLATAGVDRDVTVWNLESLAVVREIRVGGVPDQLAFSSEGARLAATFELGSGWAVAVYDATKGVAQASHLFLEPQSSISWDPHGRWLAVSQLSGRVQLVDSRTGAARELGRHPSEAVTAQFAPQGGYLFTGAWDGELICWDTDATKRAFVAPARGWMTQFSRDGREFAVVSGSSLHMYRFEAPTCLRRLGSELGTRLKRASFSADSRWLAVPVDGKVGVWNIETPGPSMIVKAGSEPRAFVSSNPAGLDVLDASQWTRWSLPSELAQEPRFVDAEKLNGFRSASQVGDRLAVTTTSGTRWHTMDRKQVPDVPAFKTIDGLSTVSPNGKWLGMFRPFSPMLAVYALPGFERVAQLSHHHAIYHISFSPDGAEVAIASREGVEVWRTQDWTRRLQLSSHSDMLYAPDGLTCWLSQDARESALCDLKTLTPLLPLPRKRLPLAVSPDGNLLVVVYEAQELELWDLRVVKAQLAGLGLDWEASDAPPREHPAPLK